MDTAPLTDRPVWDIEGFLGSLTGSSPHTRKAYEGDLRQFTTWAERGGATGPGAVDHLVLRRYLAYLTTRGLARTSIARKAAALRTFFGWLRKRGVVPTDPTRNLRTPKGDRRLPRVPKAAEVATLLEEPPALADPENPRALAVAARDDAILEILYGAGLRISELCGLAPSDIDQRAGLVTVLGKRSKIRRVPLGEVAIAAIRAYLDGGRTDSLRAHQPRRRPVPQPPGTPPHPSRCPADPGATPAHGRSGHQPPHPATRLRHPSSGRGSRPAGGAGTSRPRRRGDHPAIHSSDEGPPASGV